jgi:hypothetical protein
MAVRKEDYIQWKNDQITQAMCEDVAEAASEIAASLLKRTESNPPFDQLQKGYLKGIQAALEWEPDFIQEEEVDA